MNVQLAVVIRTDLAMSPGLLAAQACHLNDEWLRKRIFEESKAVEGSIVEHVGGEETRTVTFNADEFQWIGGPVISILAVNIPEELKPLITKAEELKVPHQVWRDTIPSKIFGTPERPVYLEVVVGVAFGPSDDEKIKQITGGLPLYKGDDNGSRSK